MPRIPNNEIRLRCNICKEFTQSINPIIIQKEKNNRFHIKAVCSICNKFKTKCLNIEQVKLLPDEIRHAPDNTTFTDTIERNGGKIPILPLIGAIAGGLTALAAVGGTTASAIIGANSLAEDVRHHRQLEDIARGNGISNKGVERYMTDDELIHRSIEFLTGKGFSVTI